jgi:hypothetical protein
VSNRKPALTEPTKTITLKVPLWTLIGCYDLLEKAGFEVVGGIGHGEVVSQVLGSFISNLLEKGELPTYDPAELKRKFRSTTVEPTRPSLGDMDSIPPVEKGPLQAIGSLRELSRSFEPTPPPDVPSSRKVYELAEQVERAILGDYDPDITQEVTIDDVVPAISNAPATLNLYRLPGLSPTELLNRAPKDRFVVLVHSKEADALVKQAICVLYKSLPVELWGSKIAESQINLLIQRHDGSDS